MAIKVRTAREIAEDRKKKEGKPPIKTTVYKMLSKNNTNTETKKPAVTFKNNFMPQAQKSRTTNILTINKSNMPTNSTKDTKTVSKGTQTATNTVNNVSKNTKSVTNTGNNVKTRIQQNKPQGAVEKNLGKMYIEPFAQKKLTADSTAKEILNIKKGPLEKPKKQSYNSAMQVKDVPYNKAVDAKKQKAVRDIKAKADTDILNNYNNAMKGLAKAQQDPNYYNFIESGKKLAGTGRDFDTMKEFKKLNPSLYKSETVIKTSPLNNGLNINTNAGNNSKYTYEEKQNLDYLRGKYNTTKSDADLKEYETAKDIIDKGNKVNTTKKKEFEGEMLKDPNAKANILNRRTALSEAEGNINKSYPMGVDRGKQDLSKYIDEVKKGVRAEDANLPLANAQGMLDYIAVVEKEKQALEAYSAYDLTQTAEQYHQKQKDIDKQINELEKSKYGLDTQAQAETEKQIYDLRKERDRAKTQWQISNNQELTDKEKAKVKEWESGVAGNLDGLAQQGKGWLQEQTAITGTQYDPFAHSGDSISEYSRATTKEKDIYAAIVAKYGFDAGNEWLKINAGEFAERKAKVDAESLRNMESTGLQQAAILGNDFMAGLQTFTSGAQSAIRSMQGDTRPLQQTASNLVRNEIRPELTALARFGSDFVYNTANMLPTVATSAINPWVGTALMGFTSYGNAVNESLSEGMRFDEAVSYGIMTGASEALLEKAMGGFATMGGLTKNAKGALTKIDDVIKKSVKNPKIVGAINVLVNQAVSSAGEFSEEYLQEILNPVFRNLAFGEDNEIKPFTQEALYAGLLGAVTSLGMNSASYGANYKNSINKQSVAEEIATTLGMDVGEVYKALGNPPEVKSKVKQLPNEIASVLSNGSAIINKTADGNERVKYEVLNSLNNVEKAFIVDAINKDIESRGGSLDKIVADYKQSYLSKNIPVTSKDVFDTLVASYIKDVYSGNTSLGDADVIINNKTALDLYSRSFNGSGEDIGVLGLQGDSAVDGDVRFSINPKFVSEYDAWVNDNKSSSSRYFNIGTISEPLQSIGINPAKIRWYKVKIIDIQKKHRGMTDDVIKQVPNILENPIIAMQSQTAVNRVVIIGEIIGKSDYSEEMQPVLAALELKPSGEISNYTVMTGAYPKEVQNLFDTSDILYIDPNEKRTNAWLQSHGLQLPSYVTQYGSIDNVTYVDKDVKGVIGDSTQVGKTAMELAFGNAQSKNKINKKSDDAKGRNQFPALSDNALSDKNISQENLNVKEKNNVSDDDGLQRKSMQSTLAEGRGVEGKPSIAGERRETTGGRETKQPAGKAVRVTDSKGKVLFEGETKTPEGKAEYLHFASSYAKKGAIANVKGAVIPAKAYTDGMVKLQKKNASKGIETVFLTHATLNESNVNGLVSGNTVYINVGSEYSIEAINSHEELHYKLKQNPTKARLLFEEVKSTLSTQELNKILGEYKQRYAGLIDGMSDKQATDYLIEEFLADVYGGMAQDSRISALIDGADLGDVGGKNEGEVRYNKDIDFKNAVDNILNGTDGDAFKNNLVYVTQTPQVLQDLGLYDLPMLMTKKHIITTAKKEGIYNANYHYLGAGILKNIANKIADPVMIMTSKTKSDDSIVIVTDAINKNNVPVVVSVNYGRTGYYNDIEIDSNNITSIYGKDGFRELLIDAYSNNRMLFVSKQKSQQLENIPGLQLPSNIPVVDLSKNIAQFKEHVKSVMENKPKYSIGEKETATKYKTFEKETGFILSDFENKETVINQYNSYFEEAQKMKPKYDKAQAKLINNLQNAFNDEFTVVDPGAKSVKSSVSKLIRKNELRNKSGYTLNDFKDNIRGSIIMNGLEDIATVMKKLVDIYPNLDVEFKQERSGYIGFHVTVKQDGVNGEIQLTTPQMYKTKMESDAIYDKWRMRNPNKLTVQEQKQRTIANKKSYEQWNDYFEKSGIMPRHLRIASASLMVFARNTSPAEPLRTHLPSRNQRSLRRGSSIIAINSSSSFKPHSIVKSSKINTPLRQSLQSKMILDASQVDNLTHSKSSSSDSGDTLSHSPLENSNVREGNKFKSLSSADKKNAERSIKSSPNNIIQHKIGDVKKDEEPKFSIGSKKVEYEDEKYSTHIKAIDARNRKLDEIEVLQDIQILKDVPKHRAANNKENFYNTFDFLKRKFVDSGNTINTFAKLAKDKLLYPIYNNARQAQQKAEYAIGQTTTGQKTYQFSFSGKKVGESLHEIFMPIQNKKAFEKYMLNLHNIDRMAQNKPVFGDYVTAEISKQLVNKFENKHPEFKEYALKIRKYLDNLMDYRVDSGLITKEQAQLMSQMYPNYVPTYRDTVTTAGENVKDNKIKVTSTIKKAKGGSSPIIPLSEAIAQQTVQVMKAAGINAVANRIADNNDGINNFEYFVSEIKEGGLNYDVDDTTGTIFAEKREQRPNEIKFFRNGKSYIMYVSNGMFEGFNALRGNSFKVPIIEKANTIFKQLITGYNPLFMIRNSIRDIQAAGLYTKNGMNFIKAYPKAFAEIAKNGEMWQLYQAMGGFNSSFFDYEKGLKGKRNAVARYTIDKLEMANMIIEQMPRFSEFIATLDKNGMTFENILQAMYNAADITVNFGRSGTWAKVLNKTIVPFLNPSIQGTSKLIRTFAEAKGSKQWLSIIGKCMVLGVLPTILNAMVLGDREDYKMLDDRTKDNYYLFPIKDGKFLKIPKGREVSAFGNFARRLAESAQGKDVDWSSYITSIQDNVAPINPFENNLLSPILLAINNKTWYGGLIENSAMQNLREEDRWNERTDALSKWIGKTLKISPAKVNYVLDAYTGIIGDVLLPITTSKAERDLLTSSFVVDSIYTNRTSNDFYNAKQELAYKQSDEPVSEVPSITDLQLRYLNKQNTLVSDLYKAIRDIELSDKTDAEKQTEARILKTEINGIQQIALESISQLENALKDHYNVDTTQPENMQKWQAEKAYTLAIKDVFGVKQAILTAKQEVSAIKAIEYGLTEDEFFTTFQAMGDITRTDYKGIKNATANAKRDYIYKNFSDTNKQLAVFNAFGVSPEYKEETSATNTKKVYIEEDVKKAQIDNEFKRDLYSIAGYGEYKTKIEQLQDNKAKDENVKEFEKKEALQKVVLTDDDLIKVYKSDFENAKTKAENTIEYAVSIGVSPKNFLKREVEAYSEKGDPATSTDIYLNPNGIEVKDGESSVSGTKMRDTVANLLKGGYNEVEKKYFYQRANSGDDYFPVAMALNVPVDEYLKIAGDEWNIQGKKDETGKTISGTKKQAIIDRVNESGLEGVHKNILMQVFLKKINSKVDAGTKKDIVNYIYESALSENEKQIVLKKLGFEDANPTGKTSSSKGRGRSKKSSSGRGSSAKIKAPKSAKIVEQSHAFKKRVSEKIASNKPKSATTTAVSANKKAVRPKINIVEHKVETARPKINLAEHKARMAGANATNSKTINGYRDIRPDVSKMLAGRTFAGGTQEKDIIANSNLLGKYKNLLGGKK